MELEMFHVIDGDSEVQGTCSRCPLALASASGAATWTCGARPRHSKAFILDPEYDHSSWRFRLSTQSEAIRQDKYA
jgi:hypothetical protein